MNKVLLLVGFAAFLALQPVAHAQLADFNTQWKNKNKNTRSFSKMEIVVSGTNVTVHLYGACTPTACDLGAVPAMAYANDSGADLVLNASALTAEYSFGFDDIRVVVHRISKRKVVVEAFTHFTDGSGRTDYRVIETFRTLRKNETF